MNIFIIFLVITVISAVGFIKYVYYFSVGYGFSIAGIGITILILMYESKVSVMCILLILYGLRLGGYLLMREIKSEKYRKFMNGEIKENVSLTVKLSIWAGCILLYFCQCSPIFFRAESGKNMDIFYIAGIILAVVGIFFESLADFQKSRAKSENSGRFVDTGLYKIVRCPNYFGEILLWTGVFISGINIYSSFIQWICALAGYIGIIYVMFSGTRRLEIRQDKIYGCDTEYIEYIKNTPIIIPFLPIYSVTKYKWLVA